MRVAVGFLSKDRCELTKRTIEPLLQDGIDVWWFDGSRTAAGEALLADYPVHKKFANVRGGADAAIVCALTTMYKAGYDYIGLLENDVLLHQDWFGPTMALFERGRADGFPVGAVSPRAYEDRVLFQCDGYAVMHNLGAGCVIFARAAAEGILHHYRTGWTTENRSVFAQVAGVDIGRYWAFRAAEHFLTADWQFDRILASAGAASLALTPSPVEMIGQVPSLAEQGLALVERPVELLRNDKKLLTYRDNLHALCDERSLSMTNSALFKDPSGGLTAFAHQVGYLGAKYSDGWRLQWSQGFGPFAWRAEEAASVQLSALGSIEFLVSGGEKGAKVRAVDTESGYEISPELPPAGTHQLPQLLVPGLYSQRDVVLEVEPGAVFYGVRSNWPQMIDLMFGFDYNCLPPV